MLPLYFNSVYSVFVILLRDFQSLLTKSLFDLKPIPTLFPHFKMQGYNTKMAESGGPPVSQLTELEDAKSSVDSRSDGEANLCSQL